MNADLKLQLRTILQRHEGRDRAITARELSSITGSEDRKVRLAIRELRAEGLPVISAVNVPFGYFLPANWKDVTECVASNKSRLIEDAKMIRDLKHAAERYFAPATQGKLL